MPSEWASIVRRWQRASQGLKRQLADGRTAPDANEEYLLYQNILGAWPWKMESQEDRQHFLERMQEYSSKALSESKVNLSWLNPNPEYIEAVHAFLADLLLPDKRGRESRFVQLLDTILPRVRFFGALNSLAQTVLKLTSPGVPDFYQGTELWDLSLVDPDNRRPVDYELRTRLLAEMKSIESSDGPLAVCRHTLADLSSGQIKLWVSHKTLALRSELPALFRKGSYQPLELTGGQKQHGVAFLRSYAGRSLLTVVPLFTSTLMHGKTELPLADAWGNTAISLPENAPNRYRNIYTGEQVTVNDANSLCLSELFSTFPVGVLLSEGK
jgi:(1->4)-alpha-D-glucan 1-alpha-D-glucosylmutase